MIRTVLLSLCALLFASCDKSTDVAPDAPPRPTGSVTLEHPDGTYRVTIPNAWRPDDSPTPGPYGAMRWSAAPDLFVSTARVPPGVEVDLTESMARFFTAEQPAGEPVTETFEGGAAAHRQYVGETKGTPWKWWIRVVHTPDQLITITVSDAAERFDVYADEYLAGAMSLTPVKVPALPDETLPRAHRDSDIERILRDTPGQFWGRAIDDNGVIQPTMDQTVETRLLSDEEGTAVANEAIPAGLAVWCGIPWKPLYLAHQRARRAGGWSDRRAGYAGTLYGVAQGRLKTRLDADIGPCSDAHRVIVDARLREAAAAIQSP